VGDVGVVEDDTLRESRSGADIPGTREDDRTKAESRGIAKHGKPSLIAAKDDESSWIAKLNCGGSAACHRTPPIVLTPM
jgi:hypothetical protein